MQQSDAEAVKWYRKPAEQGQAKAQNDLGLMYEDGRGVQQSDVEAIKWYRKAGEQGDGWMQAKRCRSSQMVSQGGRA